MHHPEFSEQEQIRRRSLEEIRSLGIDPYPPETFPVSHTASQVKSMFEKREDALQDISLAGRIMSRRIMGSASFAELQDESGRIQLYLRRDELCPGEDKTLYNTIFKKLLDIGDIIGVRGFAFRTQVGEISVHVKELTLLSKSIRPLPVVKEKEGKVYDAVTDHEYRYRQRYVDLIVNPATRELFRKRTKIYDSLRELFNSRGYLEVETPVLQPIPGGAAARPFVTHHNTLGVDLYLRIANELYLKRLIVGGYDGVYEFSKDFRNEGMDRTHNPEFTIMEIYVAYKDYLWMMDFTGEMIEKVALDLHGTTRVKVGDRTIDFKRPYRRVTMIEAIREATGMDISGMDEMTLKKAAEQLGVEVDETMGKGKIIDAIFSDKAEPAMIQPTFVMDYPVEMSPLCKKHRENPGLTERFELIVNGNELCNAYTELNDPIDQLERFQEGLKTSVANQVNKMKKGTLPLPVADISASFQEAVVDVLTHKSIRAAQEIGCKTVVVAGGVAANSRLREMMTLECHKAGLELAMPPVSFCTDNAAMICVAGFHQYQQTAGSPLDLDVYSRSPHLMQG
ncbi:MAG: lysine--tRNA ligase [Bacteroidales bacterium]